MSEPRRSLAPLVVAGLAAAVGLSWLWAANREYADNQRNWAYLLGALGLGVALVIALGTLIIDVWRARRRGRS